MSKDSVLGLFRQHADTHPERPALVDRERSFSYRELDRLSDRLAAHLARRGVARGELLPCWPNARPNWSSPSWRPPSAQRPTYRWTVGNPTGASGKSSASAKPLGPRHPGRGPAGATGGGHRTGARDECGGCRAETGARRQRSAVCDLHLGHHRRTQGRGDRESLLANLVSWHNRRFNMDQRSRTTLMAGVGFDVSQWEIWSTLCAGACLHLVPDEVRPDPAALLAFFAEQRISHAFAPTVMVPALAEQPAPPSLALRYLFCAGENCRRSQPAGCPIPWWITTARPRPRSSPPAASSTPKHIGDPPRSARPSTAARHSSSTPTTGLAMATDPVN